MSINQIIAEDGSITFSITTKLEGTFLEQEEQIQVIVNRLGNAMTEHYLTQYDISLPAIRVAEEKYTPKAVQKKKYQTLYGEVEIERHVYQSRAGGRAYVPLERSTGIIGSATPRFAKVLSQKYTHQSGAGTIEDLAMNHKRTISKTFVQDTVARVGEAFSTHQQQWQYPLPDFPEQVSHISISRDGTTTPVLPSGYRETMTGTISLYQRDGARLHTIYVASAPEYGQKRFEQMLDAEITKVKTVYPHVVYTGVADGAPSNWRYLSDHVSVRILDYYHASEYLSEVAPLFDHSGWLAKAYHRLKTEEGGARKILKALKRRAKGYSTPAIPSVLSKAIRYFSNNLSRMDYPSYSAAGYPIGSGVTEAACKTLVKQRLNQSGMRWNLTSIDHILLLRGLALTSGRWQQAWNYYDQTCQTATSY